MDLGLKHYLLASDFDHTLSFNDSGVILSEMLGISGFVDRIAGLAHIHLVQQGAELAYLLLHDPEYRRVRKEDLVAVGKRIRLKSNLGLLFRLLENLDGHRFDAYVISAAPEEVIRAALRGIVPEHRIFGTRFRYHPDNGEIRSIERVAAGYGKVAVLEELRAATPLAPRHLVYVGDGSSDVHVMLHVNRLEGLTIAAAENRDLTSIARRTVLSDNGLSLLVPLLEEILGWNGPRIRAFFEAQGFVLQDWDKARTDLLTIRDLAPARPAVA
jgi:HAD superfamily phosphoserine phosphatase-like hydrolase